MAKIDFEIPISSIHGSLDHDSEIYYAKRLGTTVASHYPKHKDPKKITSHRHDLNNRFAKAVTQASEILQDPGQCAEWQTRFEEQKHTAKKPYKLFRNFIIATLAKEME